MKMLNLLFFIKNHHFYFVGASAAEFYIIFMRGGIIYARPYIRKKSQKGWMGNR
jgi:hypothetical protein